jgi:NAD(P)-dependent dehydrogenase (short-subunit alcohol dehydrogenase family)
VTGRSVLVVGASSGIGLAVAARFAADGARLVLAARDSSSLQAARSLCLEAGAEDVRIEAGDVSDENDAARFVDSATQAYGRLDVVAHTATVMAYGTVEQMPADIFTAAVDTSVRGTLYLARNVLARFRRQGSGTFIVVNSLLGSVTVPNMGAYATAKWGQRALARTLQQETRDAPGIHVCIASPGSVNTPIYYQAANYTGRGARPPGVVVQPERAAAAIVRLADKPRDNLSVPIGPVNPIIIAGFRLLPFIYDRIVGPLFRVGALTRDQIEPTDGNVRAPNPAQDRLRGRWPKPKP